MIILIKLLLAHCIGDFVLQPEKWVKNKRKKTYKSPFLYAHIAVHTLALLVIFQFDISYWPLYLFISTTHYLIDLAKLSLYSKKKDRLLFILDQVAHLIMIWIVLVYYRSVSFDMSIVYRNDVLLFILAIVCLTSVSGVIMKILMSRWSLEENDLKHSLSQAGLYIGILERLFVFGFIVLNQWEAIGLLITAKSVFRFGDLSKAKDRKLTEYVLIGTMLSFGSAIIIGLAYVYLSSILI
ncbi:DUF3307 domain-containing protein [Dokdonia sp. Hel_I_53]|uniref:DUF3307 domain-containing protein n=1 Tax=Dokdonia sp. Hel_I_53 TaxID=1566287 RepID=UPI00119A672F|nr:DUF3307 domain-containing protein [Dokdonia sp. Hel_I_53]TVZ51791.1 uncharacterized protein DUF3307 [Dokdonia sp. Hel_I_53]